MAGIAGPTVKPQGVLLTVKSQYDADRKAIDQAVKNQGKAPDPKNVKPTVKNNTTNLDDDSFPEEDNKAGLKVTGLSSYYTLLLDEDYANVTGTEGFIDSIKNAVAELLRIIKECATWLWELVYNRVRSLRRRVRHIRNRLRGNGIKLLDQIVYPESIIKLLLDEPLPKGPDVIVNRVADLHAFYKRLMAGEKCLGDAAVDLPPDVDDMQILRLIKHTVNEFSKAALMQSLSNTGVTLGALLPGRKKLKVTSGDSGSYNAFGISMVTLPPLKRDLNKTFTPDASIAERTLTQIDLLLTQIESQHKSQSSIQTAFTKTVSGLNKPNRFATDSNAKAAYRYNTWLVNFQHKSMSSPLSYVFSTLNAALDYVESMAK